MIEAILRYPYLALIALCLCLYLPGISVIPPLDRDEARYIQASKQMIESDDYLNINFQDQPRHKKPIGIYWLQTASVHLTAQAESFAIWAFRLPATLGGTLAILLTFYFARKQFPKEHALLGSALLASCLMLVTETHQGKTDAMLLATIVAAQGALWQLYAGEKKWCYFLTLWIAAGMGTMIKGPVAPMIVALTTLSLMAWDRRIDLFIAMKPWFGIPLFLLIVSPWFYAISQETGSNFIADSFMEDILPKLVGAQESHGAPPSYYAMLVWVMFWPAVFFLLPALYHGWKYKTNSNIRFLLAWLIPTWLFFELVPTKLPHYVLPTYPALALLIAWYLYQHFERSTLQKINAIIGSIIAVALAGGFIALPIITEKTFHPFSLIAVGGIVLVLFAVWRHTLPTSKRLIFATLGVVITFGSVFQFIFPSLDHIWISKRIQQATHTYIAEETQIISVGYSEPSLVFLMGTGIMLTSAEDAAARIKQRSAPTLLLLEERHAQAFHEGYSDLPKPVGKVEGLNYSKAKPVSIAIYKVGHATE